MRIKMVDSWFCDQLRYRPADLQHRSVQILMKRIEAKKSFQVRPKNLFKMAKLMVDSPQTAQGSLGKRIMLECDHVSILANQTRNYLCRPDLQLLQWFTTDSIRVPLQTDSDLPAQVVDQQFLSAQTWKEHVSITKRASSRGRRSSPKDRIPVQLFLQHRNLSGRLKRKRIRPFPAAC